MTPAISRGSASEEKDCCDPFMMNHVSSLSCWVLIPCFATFPKETAKKPFCTIPAPQPSHQTMSM